MNAPALLFICFNLFIHWSFIRSDRYKGFGKNSYQIKQMIYVHRIYVFLWALFHVSDFIFGFILNNGKVTETHAFIISLQPSAIFLTIFIAYVLEFRKYSQFSKEIDTKIEEELLGGEKDELLTQNVGDSLIDKSMLDSIIDKHAPNSILSKFGKQHNPSQNLETLGMIKEHWAKG